MKVKKYISNDNKFINKKIIGRRRKKVTGQGLGVIVKIN